MTRYLITPSGARDLAAMADRGELADPEAVIQDLAYTIEQASGPVCGDTCPTCDQCVACIDHDGCDQPAPEQESRNA